jgi:hypothetical protein
MKRKAFKIQENTLFVYKKLNQQALESRGDTDTTTTITTTGGTTGIFNYENGKK